jgi:hypothetical protein
MGKRAVATWILIGIMGGAAFWVLKQPRAVVWWHLLGRNENALQVPTADRQWIVGRWKSHKLDYGEFQEWIGTAQLELLATSPDEIDLFLISADGKRSRASDSWPSLMDDRKFFFGPIGSGLLFHYTRAGKELVLDSYGDRPIHVQLHKAEPAPQSLPADMFDKDE